MENHFITSDYISRDFFVVQFGDEQCKRGYGFGPCVRNNYFLHYVVSGKGIFRTESKTYSLGAGTAFLIRPGQLTYYQADEDDPWHYRWIEFGGENVETILAKAELSEDKPIFFDGNDLSLGKAMAELVTPENVPCERALAAGWSVAAALTAAYEGNRHESGGYHIRRAISYIQSKVHHKILVSDVASYVGIDRSYLGRLFRKHRGMSTRQYIINSKMEAAAQFLMLNRGLSIAEIARSVGYDDQFDFSRTFRARYGMSPSQWRNAKAWEQTVKNN